jgi:hypothetical protein
MQHSDQVIASIRNALKNGGHFEFGDTGNTAWCLVLHLLTQIREAVTRFNYVVQDDGERADG